MARIRTVKPEYWSSPDTAACEDPWARLLFIAMWNWADDNGRGTANAKELAGFAFPNDDKIEPSDVRRMLGGIRRAFGVDFYVIDGRPYYAIPSWDRHQKIDKRGTGKYPGPEQGEPWDPDPSGPPDLRRSGSRSVSAESSEGSAESTPTPPRKPGAGTGEQGNRGSTTSATADALTLTEITPPAPDEDAEFETWWKTWPRKDAKADARKAYKAARRKKVPAELLLNAAAEQLAAWKAGGKEAQFIPYGATWLRGERYNDEVERPKFTVITNSASPWEGMRIPNGQAPRSPWSEDMGRTS
jgi:hypothetical protein